MGFDAEWGVLGAADVGAPHKRDRIWILANANSDWKLQSKGSISNQRKWFGNSSDLVAHADGSGRLQNSGDSELRSSWTEQSPENQGGSNTPQASEKRKISDANCSQLERRGLPSGVHSQHAKFECGGAWWHTDPADAAESCVGRVADGVAARVDRLKAIGNGQVPAVAATAWGMLK
jgi:DNA (cytosine-5)-methyltransferase 1